MKVIPHKLAVAFFTFSLVPALFGLDVSVKEAEAIDGGIVIKSQDAVAFVPVTACTSVVARTSSEIKVDGDFSDWIKSGIKPIMLDGEEHITWYGGDGSGGDLSAELFLGADDVFLYTGIKVKDGKAPAPHSVEIAIADADSPLITTWRDVGKRYGIDDLHASFSIGESGVNSFRWMHVQDRMQSDFVSNAFGTEEERRDFVANSAPDAKLAKVFSASRTVTQEGGGTETFFECAFPWRMLLPYSPVTYKPLKFNIIVRDRNSGSGAGMLGWMPGLAGTYSGAHFATLDFEVPERNGIEIFAQLPKYHYLNTRMDVEVSVYNHGPAISGIFELRNASAGATNVYAKLEADIPHGLSKQTLSMHSEDAGVRLLHLNATLKYGGGEVSVPVNVPSANGAVEIQPVQDVLEAIERVAENAAVMSNLYERAIAAGVDDAYPRAYWTLQQMFIQRCKHDLRGGESQRVLDNAAYLSKIFKQHKSHLEKMINNPNARFFVPKISSPESLVIKDGFYFEKDRPVFLWGPCLFWFMRNDQHYTWELGFNSACPEMPSGKPEQHAEIGKYLENFYTNGVCVNVSVGNYAFDDLRKQHPETANVDPNNFLPVLIQHPLVREEVRNRIHNDLEFYKEFPAVHSYWLWNEPDYVNFSEFTRQDFIKYLKNTYGSIDKLNVRWRSSLKSFDDVQLPRGLDNGNHAPWVDYRRFLDDMLYDFFLFLKNSAKEVDPARPTHVKYMCISAAFFNMEKLQTIGEICGNDGNAGARDLLFVDLCRSIYPDKPVVNTEVHIWYKDYYLVSLVPWRLALHGVADANWWCWHANHRFSNSVGSAESMHALSIPSLDIRRLFYPYIYSLVTKEKKVATLYQDVIRGRTDDAINRLRFHLSPAQLALGLQPFYATEKKIGEGILNSVKLLVATESKYVRDTTYREVVNFVKGGGWVIVEPDSFLFDEYGCSRDASELFSENGRKEFIPGVSAVTVGKGCVLRIGDLSALKPNEMTANSFRKKMYRDVIYSAMADLKILDPVRLRPSVNQPEALDEWDIRSAPVGTGHVICALPLERWEMSDLKLETDRPIKRIVNLITGEEVPVEQFKLELGPNLFFIELL